MPALCLGGSAPSLPRAAPGTSPQPHLPQQPHYPAAEPPPRQPGSPLALTAAALRGGRQRTPPLRSSLRSAPAVAPPWAEGRAASGRDLAKFATTRPGFHTSRLSASPYFNNLPFAGSSQRRQRRPGRAEPPWGCGRCSPRAPIPPRFGGSGRVNPSGR